MNCDFFLHLSLNISDEACAAAQTSLRAAQMQAKATRDAGHWSAAGGVAAILAALVALVGIRVSAFYQKKSADDDREFQIKREVYFGLTDALMSGLLTVTQLADLSVSIKDAMADYLIRLPSIGRSHVISDPETILLILTSVNQITAFHNQMVRQRIDIERALHIPGNDLDLLHVQSELMIDALRYASKLNDPLLDTLAAVRESLGLPIDIVSFKTAVAKASTTAQKQVAQFISDLRADRDRRAKL